MKICKGIQPGLSVLLLILFTILPLYMFGTTGTDSSVAAETIKPQQIACGELTISVDPRVEIIEIIGYLSGSDEVKPDTLGYSEAITAWFAPYKAHRAVTLFREMEKRNFSCDFPVEYLLQYDSVPFTDKVNKIPGDLIPVYQKVMKHIGKPALFAEFIREVNDFYKQSHFEQFFQSQSGFYSNLLAQTDSVLAGNSIVETMVGYYGYRHHSYNLVILPLLGGNGYGPYLENPRGEMDVYCVCADFGNQQRDKYIANLAGMMYHEWSHSYNNPLVEKHMDELENAEALYKPLKKQMNKYSYSTWYVTIAENCVRAASIRLCTANPFTAAYTQSTYKETEQGFIYVDIITEQLVKYETERKQTGITYPEFFPHIVQCLMELATNPTPYIEYKSRFAGTIGNASMSPFLVIIPDPKLNPGVKEYIIPTADFLRERLGVRVVTDTQAMKMKLKNYNFYIYGTIESNKILRKYQGMFPFRVLPDKIIADKEYSGTGLRIVSSMSSPFNPAKGMAVYTAQTMEAMKNSNAMDHGTEDFVISDSKLNILGKGFYDKTEKGWQFKPVLAGDGM